VLIIKPGMMAYHGTFEHNVEGIAQKGICRMGRCAIHLFLSWQECCSYTRRFEAIACVDLHACHGLGIKFVIDRQTNIILTEGILGILPISCVVNICSVRCRTHFLVHSDHRVTNATVYSQKLDALLDVRDLVAEDPAAYPDLAENPSVAAVFEMASRVLARRRSSTVLARGRSYTDGENLEDVQCAGVSLDAGSRAVATALRTGANAGLSGDPSDVMDADNDDEAIQLARDEGFGRVAGDELEEGMVDSSGNTQPYNDADGSERNSVWHPFEITDLGMRHNIGTMPIYTNDEPDGEEDPQFDSEKGCQRVLASFEVEGNVKPTPIPKDATAVTLEERVEELIAVLGSAGGITCEVTGPEIEPEPDQEEVEMMQEGSDRSNPSAPQGSLSIPAPPTTPALTGGLHAKNLTSRMCGQRGSGEFSRYRCTKERGHKCLARDVMCCSHQGQAYWGAPDDSESGAGVFRSIKTVKAIHPVQQKIYNIAQRHQQKQPKDDDDAELRA
jgi:hypothetical protein